MDSLEIVPPPRSTREMMRQIEEKSPAVRKAEAKAAELEAINPTGEFECQTAELPVQLVEPWAINNVFVEGNQMTDSESQKLSGVQESHSQQVTTPDGRQTWPLPRQTKNLLKGDKMDQTVDTKVKKSVKQRAIEVGALAGGFAFGFMIAGIFVDQKVLIKAVKDLKIQTQTLENVVASYVIK